MTPSLLQKIELLTLNRMELSELLTQELNENPVLEEAPEYPEAEPTDRGAVAEAVEVKDEAQPEDAPDDFDYEYFFGDYLSSTNGGRERESDDERASFELFLASPTSLVDHLAWQLNLSEASQELREVAAYIIGNLNEDGYLTAAVDEMAAGLGVPVETVEAALRLVQSFDPSGVGCRNLQECLLLQVRAAGLEGSLAERLVENCLPLVELKKFGEIARELGCSTELVLQALETLRHFSPRPGEKFSSGKPIYVQPDVYIFKVDDDYQIDLNDDGMPKLRLNRAYREMLKEQRVSREARSFIRERLRSALDLLRSIDQRQQTIYRVCTAIVSRQRDFLENGPLSLRPMLIKEIAEELGVHSSTISRVVANKYCHTPQGVIELRKFFSVGVESLDGENVSTALVKERIKRIIGNEDPSRPLSDQKIAKLLTREGIQITRRTVAKYRDQIRMPGSRERKAAAPA
jgi:RNA polymerase sigma-54 factor